MLSSQNKILIQIFITLSGISRCIMVMLVPVVIADAVDGAKFTSAMGLFLALYGLFTIVLGPIVGKHYKVINTCTINL